MVSISYIFSLVALSAVRAAPTAENNVIQQTSNDANAVSNDLASLSQQLHSGLSLPRLNLGPILVDIEKLIGDVVKFPTPSHIEKDISDVESILKEAISTFTGLGGNFSAFLNEAGTQDFTGNAHNVVSGITNTLKGVEGKIAGIIGFVPKEIQDLISEFFSILEKIPFP